MDKNRFSFVTKFRIGNLYFTLFCNAVGNYFVVNKDDVTKTEDANFYKNFNELYAVFSDNLTGDQIKTIRK